LFTDLRFSELIVDNGQLIMKGAPAAQNVHTDALHSSGGKFSAFDRQLFCSQHFCYTLFAEDKPVQSARMGITSAQRTPSLSTINYQLSIFSPNCILVSQRDNQIIKR
jgi:hypothetical protein